MMVTGIRFLNIILVALVSGATFGIWFGYNPKTFSASTYIEQQQGAIRGLNTMMPALGLGTVLLTLFSAFQQKDDKSTVLQLLTASVLLIGSGLITRFGNQPINSMVMTWTADSMPADWTAWRDRWWSFHIIRTLASLLALLLIVWAALRKS